MREIVIEKLNNNDESCVLTGWLVENAQRVNAHDVIATLETSKATVDLESDAPGILQQLVEAGAECKFGEAVAYLFENEEERQGYLAGRARAQPAMVSSLTITKDAQALIQSRGLSESQLLTLGKKVIRKYDVETLLAGPPAEQQGTVAISRRQASIAKTVSLSHAQIPGAFLAMKVYCDSARQALKELMASEQTLVGLPELLIKIVADLCTQFPFFYGHLASETQFISTTEPNIGVTVDVGKGLFIPIIQNARAQSIVEIAETLMEFRVKALRNAFKEEELGGGHLTISLNVESDVTCVVPVILPSQSCMISLCSLQEELALTADQTVTARHYVNLGLAYDHRVVNGYDAVRFLKAIKSAIESPEKMPALRKQPSSVALQDSDKEETKP